MIFADVTPRPEREPFRVIGVAKVAKSLGVSTSHLYNVLSGIANPSESLDQEIKAAAASAEKLLHQIEAARIESNLIWERVVAQDALAKERLKHKLEIMEIRLGHISGGAAVE